MSADFPQLAAAKLIYQRAFRNSENSEILLILILTNESTCVIRQTHRFAPGTGNSGKKKNPPGSPGDFLVIHLLITDTFTLLIQLSVCGLPNHFRLKLSAGKYLLQ